MKTSECITKVISSSSELEDVLNLRKEVFVSEQGVPLSEEIDSLDTLEAIDSGRVIHVMATIGPLLVGAARLIPVSYTHLTLPTKA